MLRLLPNSLLIPFLLLGHANVSAQSVSKPAKVSAKVKSAAANYFLFISDIHLNSFSPGPSMYGADPAMDIWDLAKANFLSITRGANPPKFIVYTGDLPDHNPDSGNDHDTNLRTVLDELVDIAGNIPLFYAPGNNDPRGGDYSPFTDANCQTPLDLVSATSGYPAPNAEKIYSYDKLLGYYSARPFAGLRIIALNTVMFSNRHHSEYDPHCSYDTLNQVEESAQQLNWLKGELAAAKSANENVYLIMHIPPGHDAFSDNPMWKYASWSDSLLSYTNEFSSTISGVFYGHTHMDEVRRLTIPGDTAHFSEIAISAPGISPIFKNNPGFKTVNYNKRFEATNYTTHYTFMTNSVWGVNGEWGSNTYSFTDVYGSGKTIKQVISNYSTQEVYQRMIKTYMVKSPYNSNSQFILDGITVK